MWIGRNGTGGDVNRVCFAAICHHSREIIGCIKVDLNWTSVIMSIRVPRQKQTGSVHGNVLIWKLFEKTAGTEETVLGGWNVYNWQNDGAKPVVGGLECPRKRDA